MSGRCVIASTEIWMVVVMVVILSPPTMSPSALKLTFPPTSPMRMPLESGVGGEGELIGIGGRQPAGLLGHGKPKRWRALKISGPYFIANLPTVSATSPVVATRL